MMSSGIATDLHDGFALKEYSYGERGFADKVPSALQYESGGHEVKKLP
jgi:hypothetical protein